MTVKSYYFSPIGWIEAVHTQGTLSSLAFVAKRPRWGGLLKPGLLRRELRAYFKGSRKPFRVRLSEKGTDFQKRVWNAIRTIPPGSTRSYKDIAMLAGRSKAVRAAASACAKNPLMLVTPCHRVVASGGALAGYAYGLKKKAWLLKHEGATA